jgi:Putative peptidoglycan binding domain
MEGRGSPRDRDPDDWFVDPEVPAQEDEATRGHEEPRAEDWLAATPADERAPRVAHRERLLLAAAALAVLLLAGLAAAGVFSSGGSHHGVQSASTTAPRPPTTAPTTTTRTFTVLPTSALKPGDTGTQVRELQRALTALGYSPGAADGSYGPATERAVARFQRASGLTADGIFGPKTLRALRRAAGS